MICSKQSIRVIVKKSEIVGTARRKYKRNYAWLPVVWDYLTKVDPSLYLSYEEIVENAHLLGVDTMHKKLRSSKICPNKLRFAKIMGAQEGIDKIKERGHYGQYLWRMHDDYRESRFERGKVIL